MLEFHARGCNSFRFLDRMTPRALPGRGRDFRPHSTRRDHSTSSNSCAARHRCSVACAACRLPGPALAVVRCAHFLMLVQNSERHAPVRADRSVRSFGHALRLRVPEKFRHISCTSDHIATGKGSSFRGRAPKRKFCGTAAALGPCDCVGLAHVGAVGWHFFCEDDRPRSRS